MKKINRSYIYLGVVFVIYYAFWSYGLSAIRHTLNPSVQSFENMILVLGIMLLLQILTNYSFPIGLCRIEKGKFREFFRLKKVSWEELFYSFLVFISFNGMAVFLIALQEWVLGFFNLSFEMNLYLVPENLTSLIVLVFAAGVVIPIGEELFFRGMIIRGTEKIGARFGIFISAWFFAINHDNPFRLVTLFLFAYLVGVIVYYTGSLIPGIVFHIITNSIFEIYSYIMGKEKIMGQYANVDGAIESSMMRYVGMTVLFIVCLCICIFSLKKIRSMSKMPKLSKEVAVDVEGKIGRNIILAATGVITILFIFNYINGLA